MLSKRAVLRINVVLVSSQNQVFVLHLLSPMTANSYDGALPICNNAEYSSLMQAL